MFTFGRSRELEYVAERYSAKRTMPLLRDVVVSVHDYLEQKSTSVEVEAAIERALVEGEGGIWETAGSWLLKLNSDVPNSNDLWKKLSRHSRSTVRFRIASFIDDVREDLARDLYQQLSSDVSKRVRDHAWGKWDFRNHPEKYGAPARPRV